MKRTNDSSRLTEFFVKAGLVVALAAAMLAPTTVKIHGSEAPRVEHGWPMLKGASWNALPLPPIPHLETMPWLVQRAPKGFKIDTLLAPYFEVMGPSVAGADGLISSLAGRPPSVVETSRNG